jgi:hypothetical protein
VIIGQTSGDRGGSNVDQSMRLSGVSRLPSANERRGLLSSGLAADGAPMRRTVTLWRKLSQERIEHEIVAVHRDDRITPATLALSIAE